jgi:hypothetical protein
MIGASMPGDLLIELDRILASNDPIASLDYLIEEFRAIGRFELVFEGRLMKKRHELGLPLIQSESSADFPAESRAAYDEAMVAAAHEAGVGFLQADKIERAWPYFRAIGEFAPIAEAIEKLQPSDDMEGVIGIAFQEGVHPLKGLELILHKYGMCRAITSFGMYAVTKDREKCLAMLARGLDDELRERGYTDPSHLVSVLQYAPEITDPTVLEMLYGFCRHGQSITADFRPRGNPPFEDPFFDYVPYIQAVRGIEVDQNLDHFRRKLEGLETEQAAYGPAPVLINLLVRLERYNEALKLAIEYPPDPQFGLPAPSAIQLCYLAKDYGRLRELAREKGDFLTYSAASILAESSV